MHRAPGRSRGRRRTRSTRPRYRWAWSRNTPYRPLQFSCAGVGRRCRRGRDAPRRVNGLMAARSKSPAVASKSWHFPRCVRLKMASNSPPSDMRISVTRSLPPCVPNTWAHTRRRTGWSTGRRLRVTASNTGPPVRCSQLKWRTIDACDVIEHIAIRTAASHPAESGFSTPRAVSMCTGARALDRGVEAEVDHGPQLDQPRMALEPVQELQVPPVRPVAGGLEVAGVGAGHGHGAEVVLRRPLGGGEAPPVGRRCRRASAPRPRPARSAARPSCMGENQRTSLCCRRVNSRFGVSASSRGDAVGDHRAVERDVRVPGDEGDETDGARVRAARRDHLRLLARGT